MIIHERKTWNGLADAPRLSASTFKVTAASLKFEE